LANGTHSEAAKTIFIELLSGGLKGKVYYVGSEISKGPWYPTLPAKSAGRMGHPL
jgi:hypothetical protein